MNTTFHRKIELPIKSYIFSRSVSIPWFVYSSWFFIRPNPTRPCYKKKWHLKAAISIPVILYSPISVGFSRNSTKIVDSHAKFVQDLHFIIIVLVFFDPAIGGGGQNVRRRINCFSRINSTFFFIPNIIKILRLKCIEKPEHFYVPSFRCHY